MGRNFTSFAITFVTGLAAILLFPYYVINPGVVIEDHLKIKDDCFACHTLGEGAVKDKCAGCHNLNAIGLMTTDGIDRKDKNIRSNTLHNSVPGIQCFDCHTEHNGLSRENATLIFRHDVLSGDTRKKCTSCHIPEKPADEIHSILKEECSYCHYTGTWKPSHFKHSLLGDRLNECSRCHANMKPEDTLHKGLGNEIECVSCHNTDGWKPSTFDHSNYFRFDRNHPSNCASCHDMNRTLKTYTCYNCHEHTPSRIAKKHLKEGITDFENCVKCHKTGDKKETDGREDRRKRDDD